MSDINRNRCPISIGTGVRYQSEYAFNPHAYQVFGPKILASRGDFEDIALESRFLSEEMGGRELRTDVPINLPTDHKAEALALRNKLLMFRFRNVHRKRNMAEMVDHNIEPRLNQIFAPLLSIIEDPTARENLRAVVQQCQRKLVVERGLKVEAQVLSVIQEILALSDSQLSIKEITSRFADIYQDECEYKVTPKWIGGVIRKKLHIKAQKSHGIYAIPESEKPKIEQLLGRYGLK